MKNLKIIEAVKGDLPENILEFVSLNEFFILHTPNFNFTKYVLICINKQGNICRVFYSDSFTSINGYYQNLSTNQINQILNYL